MTAKTSEASRLPVPLHRCHGALHGANNGTCVEQLSIFPPFSSTLALLVLVVVLVGIVLVSLATFHFHKRKLRNRKIQRAQEEYERDSRSPARAGASLEPVRPCVIIRLFQQSASGSQPTLPCINWKNTSELSRRISFGWTVFYGSSQRIIHVVNLGTTFITSVLMQPGRRGRVAQKP
uniref:Si:dkey-35i13.1 n=1 Tax=Cynoglossus semilaevis TaxID=244447 RepID=A0A3P8WWQ6_CYNSE